MNRPDLSRIERPRAVLMTACAVSIVLAVASLSWWYAASRPRHIVSVRTVHAARTSVSVSDCPASAACRPDGTVRPAVLALVRAQFGPDSITGSSAVVNLQTGVRYEESVQVQIAAGVSVQVTTRCVTGSATPASVEPSSIPSNGPTSLVAVVAGRDGCSAAVAMQVPAGTTVPWGRAVELIRSASLQLEQ